MATPSPSGSGSRSLAARSGSLVRRTGVAVRGALGRPDGRAVFGLATAGYLVAYLVGIGYLGRATGPADGPWDVSVAADPLALLARRRAPFLYEPVASLRVGGVELLVAPLNLGLGAGLAALVGVTLAVSWVAWRGPAACRIGAGAGAAAGIPGILSGFACCGPTLLVIFGIQASTGVLLAFQWLVPAAVLMLLATLLWVGSKVDPTAV